MSDKLKLDDAKKVKEPWTAKKVITTIIIAVLSLLMIGGAYYILILIKEGTDDTYVFGTYDGEKIKYEPGTEFYLRVNSNENYQNALMTGDYSTMISCWQEGYQYELLMTAGLIKAKLAKVASPKDLVNDAIIASGTYASEDGSLSFDPEVYKNTDAAQKSSYFKYMESRFPYANFIEDLYSVAASNKEIDFIGDLAADTRSFQYFTIDYNAYPDDLALAYDISAMNPITDAEGNTVEPTLSQIKAYIYSANPEEVTPYINDVYAKVDPIYKDNFVSASNMGNGLQEVSAVMNNIGDSMFYLNSIQSVGGDLAAAYNEDSSKEWFNGNVGDTFMYAVPNGYVFVRVASLESDDTFKDFTTSMYNNYSSTITYSDFANEVLNSDKHVDNFYAKFLNLLFGDGSTN